MSAAKKNTAFTFTACLVDSGARPALKANPTLASGDVKVSIDGGSYTNLTTLPTVSPAGGRAVQVALTAGEMNGDRIDVQFVDAAGAEWDDVTYSIQTTVNTTDDLSGRLPAALVSGRIDASVGAMATGVLTAGAIAADAITAAKIADGAIDSATFATGTTIPRCTLVDTTTANTDTLTAAGVRAAVGLAAANLDAQFATIGGYVDTEVAAIKAQTDQLVFVSGRVSSDLAGINGGTAGVAGFARSAATIATGTADTGATTTSIPTSSLSPAAVVADQFKGRVVIFDKSTATAALRGQATDITASDTAGILTVTALSNAPASGDTFAIV